MRWSLENTLTCNMEFSQMNRRATRSVECKWGTIGAEAAVLLSFMAFTTALTTLFLVLFVWGWNREGRYNFLFREMTSMGKWLAFGTANHPSNGWKSVKINLKTKNEFTGQSRNHTHVPQRWCYSRPSSIQHRGKLNISLKAPVPRAPNAKRPWSLMEIL